jgi:CheY-like chemotaxis protein
VELASTPGRGSRFSITLPRANLRRRDGRTQRGNGSTLAAATRTLAGRRVVVVDDDPAVVDAMRALFASWKAMAVGGADAGSVLAAVAASEDFARGDVDLIVADLRLADGKSGIDTIARLRAALGSATPAFVVSGDTSDAAQAEVRAAGVELLVKPVVAAALKDAAEGALGMRGVPSGAKAWAALS